jgi:hypothetical protein
MQNFSKEVIKIGLIDEMLNNTLDNINDINDNETEDEEIQEEISKIVDEIVCNIKDNTILPNNNIIKKENLGENLDEYKAETAEELLERIDKALNS